MSGKGAVRAGKVFTLLLSNEVMNCIIKIMKLLGDSIVVTNGVTEIVKDEIKKQEDGFLDCLLDNMSTALAKPILFSSSKR